MGGSSPSERTSERAHVKGPPNHGRGSLANSGTLGGGRHGAGEDVGGLGELVADDVGVHAQRDRGVRMGEPGRDHVYGDTSQ